MSDMEFHQGKIKKLDNPENLTLEALCELKAKENGWDKTYHDNFIELINDEGYNKYVIVGNNIYEIMDHKKGDGYDDINFLFPNADGTLTFVIQFYNGGTCFSEMLETNLKNFEQNK